RQEREERSEKTVEGGSERFRCRGGLEPRTSPVDDLLRELVELAAFDTQEVQVVGHSLCMEQVAPDLYRPVLPLEHHVHVQLEEVFEGDLALEERLIGAGYPFRSFPEVLAPEQPVVVEERVLLRRLEVGAAGAV